MGLSSTPQTKKARGIWAVHRRRLGQHFCPVHGRSDARRSRAEPGCEGTDSLQTQTLTISLPLPGLLARCPLCRVGIFRRWTLVRGPCVGAADGLRESHPRAALPSQFGSKRGRSIWFARTTQGAFRAARLCAQIPSGLQQKGAGWGG